MMLKITASHIELGQKHSSTECPIGLALKEKFPKTRFNLWYVESKVKIAIPSYELQEIASEKIANQLHRWERNETSLESFSLDISEIQGLE